MKWPRSAAGEDILQWLFWTWLDLSDTVNQRPETVMLLPLGLVYLFLYFLCKVSIHHLLRLFYVCLLLKRKNWCLWKISASLLLLWRSIVTCNRCNIVSSHKCLTYTNQTFCTMSFNRKLIKFFGRTHISKLRGYVCFIFAWTSRGF